MAFKSSVYCYTPYVLYILRVFIVISALVSTMSSVTAQYQVNSNTWSVGALCRAAVDILESHFRSVQVVGEISGFMQAVSGHCYFTLKDDSGQLRCAMFRRAAAQLNWKPRDGDQIELRGRLTIYTARGDLQLVVEQLKPAGQGRLYEQFLRIKKNLQAQGLFDQERKRIPTNYPRGVGLVTSPGAAALRDVVNTLSRRAPHVPVLLVPASVQGQAAPNEIIHALQQLYEIASQQQMGDASVQHLPFIDSILLVRGGGSLEDLWAFNSADLAHAIIQSPVPVIAGIGHESDTTIADFCADVRAATPTAAAELAAIPSAQLQQQAQSYYVQIEQRSQRYIEQHQQRLDRAHWVLDNCARTVQQYAMRLQVLTNQLAHIQKTPKQHQQQLHGIHSRLLRATVRQKTLQQAPLALHSYDKQLQYIVQHSLQKQHQQHTKYTQGIHQATHAQCKQHRQRLNNLDNRLRLLNPQHTFERGFAMLQDEKGAVLSNTQAVQAQSSVRATVADGQVKLTPEGTKKKLSAT